MAKTDDVQPKSSPYEQFLSKALKDLWKLSLDHSLSGRRQYVRQILRFVDTWIPTMISDGIEFDSEKEIKKMRRRIAMIEKKIDDADPFTKDQVRNSEEIEEEVHLAEKLLNATLDALYEQDIMVEVESGSKTLSKGG